MFGVYVSNVLAPLTSSGRLGQATQEIEEQYANEGSMFMIQVCFFFLFIYLYYVIYILPKLISIMLSLYVGI